MIQTIGIRREDKNQWERRVPIVPEDLGVFMKEGIRFQIQPSKIRCYPDEEFLKAGATVQEDLSECDLLIGVKEMPLHFIQPHKVHLFFSHTIKGQSYNMPLLKNILEKKATLLDYERIVDEQNRRLIAFGYFAGLAGIIDTLAILGKRWAGKKIANPFSSLHFAHEYSNLDEAKAAIGKVSEHLRVQGLPSGVHSFIIGVPGYGNVSQGVQEILRLLPLQKISASELLTKQDKNMAYVVLEEKDFIRPKDPKDIFDLQDYYKNPHRYRSCFEEYLPYFNVIVNTIYWDERYPRLVTFENLKSLFTKDSSHPAILEVIGDISCDIRGSIECTVKTTTPGNPAFVYDPATEKFSDGWDGPGVAIMAVDILPAEFSLDASRYFSKKLVPLLSQLIQGDFSKDLSQSGLPESLKKATIVWQGALTPSYQYLQEYLNKLR